ncbi:MAG: oligosaccharide flippase family protein [Clostridia bacterium]|nr:oligosaccharide flippase family protein [Clostridia bacterium]
MGKLFKAVAYVTIFSILTRGIGFLLRIYLSRVLGAELLGSYQVAMSVFGVILTLIASGLPTIISRKVANLRSENQLKRCDKIVSSGLIIALSISIFVCIILFAFPNILAKIFTSTHSISVLYILLPSAIASSVYAILRGALWGQKRFFTISFAEFFEQVIRIIILIILVSMPINMGLGERAGLSLTIASFISSIFVVFMYHKFGGKLQSPRGELVGILKTSTPITTIRTVSSLVTSIISIIIPARLMLYGYTSGEALAKFGIVMGMTFPLLMIPGTLISSLAVALIPEISEQTTNIDKDGVKNHETLKNQITLALSLSCVISCLLLPAFLVLGKPIGLFLFKSEEAGLYLSMSAILMVPMGLSQISSSILNAIGLEMKSLKNYAISALFLFVCIYFLPKYMGVSALIIGMAGLSIITTILNFYMLKRRNLLSLKILKTLSLMLIISVPSAMLSFFTFNILNKFIPLFFSLAISGIFSVGSLFLLSLCANIGYVKTFTIKKLRHTNT